VSVVQTPNAGVEHHYDHAGDDGEHRLAAGARAMSQLFMVAHVHAGDPADLDELEQLEWWVELQWR
jgi:hypothetical protein